MKTPKNLQEFSEGFCDTLHQDSPDDKPYIKIQIEDYEELSMIHSNLLNAIELIGVSTEIKEPDGSLGYTIQCLARLLQHFTLYSELEGITKIQAALKNNSKIQK